MANTTSLPEINSDPLAQVLEWDWGTAYEMLNSVHTILRPKEHGVPAPWAAGVRKRLSPQSQADLKTFYSQPFGYLAYTPMHLVLQMDRPKDVPHFLDYVETIPDEDFSRRMHTPLIENDSLARITDKVASGKRITEVDIEEYR